MDLPLDSRLGAAPAGQPVMALLIEPDKKGKKKKKKKKKDSRMSRILSRMYLGSAAAMKQMGDAMRDAAKKYRKKHRKSRDKKRNGAVKDAGKNFASATSELLSGSASVPRKVAKALWKKDKKKRKKGGRGKDRVKTVLLQPIGPAPTTTVPTVPTVTDVTVTSGSVDHVPAL